MEVKEDNKACDCVITQPKPGHYVEACKCEFDANLATEKKKTCKKPQCCDSQATQCCAQPEKQLPAKVQQAPQQQWSAPQCCAQPQPVQQTGPKCDQGCIEDPYAALKNCVQKCMEEKSQLVQACGMKCPECPPPNDNKAADMKAAPADKKPKDKKKGKGGKPPKK